MENIDLQTWLALHDKKSEVKVWVRCEGEELSSPNMAVVTKDELFEWEDQFDDIAAGDDSFSDIFNFTDNILDELESRLQLAPEFIKEMESIDREEFVPLNLKYDCVFQDKMNDYHTARTIRDLHEAERGIIVCVKHKLGDVDVNIHDGILIIKQKDNVSCSTSIISDILRINAKLINDRNWLQGVWSVDLKEV